MPSQAFAFQIVRDAIAPASGKTMIVGRGLNKWTSCVPELSSYYYILTRLPHRRPVRQAQ